MIRYEDIAHLEELHAITENVEVGDIEMLIERVELVAHHLVAAAFKPILFNEVFITFVRNDGLFGFDDGARFLKEADELSFRRRC